ncbi:transmembrane protein 70, mitochondrial [Pagrus major]|uniref:transmembrane protein 70, mitochondrial n=1 Tax=Pagrus major TaxID=143350 RepID=UPI003CC84E73
MISAHILRILRPCSISRSFSNMNVTAARHFAPFTQACFRVASRSQLAAVRRSLLQTHNKVQSQCPSTRCLSRAVHSEDGNLIYSGNLGNAIKGVKLFSYSTSGFSLIVMPQILLKTGLGVQGFAIQAVYCGIIGLFTFLIPVLLHLMTKGYVIRLYHNPERDTYTAITYSVFLTEKKNVFHQRQVRIPAVSQMFTTFYADHMGLLVNPDMFPIPHDYNHLMGYDKPFRFDADDINRPDES